MRAQAGEAAILQLRGSDRRLGGRAVVTIEYRRSTEDAIAHLVGYVPVDAGLPAVSDISGWPTVTFTHKLEVDEPEGTDAIGQPANFTRIVTLVAIDKELLRISITLGAKPTRDLLLRARTLPDGLRISPGAPSSQTQRLLKSVRDGLSARFANPRSRPRPRALASTSAPSGGVSSAPRLLTIEPSTPTNAGAARELEIAVSPDGSDIVIAGNTNGILTSNDGGRSFARTAFPVPPVPPGSIGFDRRGDPSVVRAPSGRFYLSYLGAELFTNDGRRQTVSVAVSEPDRRGTSFSFLSHAARCGDGGVFTTDQPHMAVDPRVRSGRPDQIYIGWRRNRPLDESITCSDSMSGFDTMVTCSADGGLTWNTTTFIDDHGMYPRLTVGHDGMVYVVTQYRRHNGTIFLTKLSSCEDGLKIQKPGFPSQIPFDGVMAGVPGLDRNNSGNILASPTVAVDPAHLCHVYVAYANQTVEGTEDIVVRGSLDGGETWTVETTANSPNAPGRRYMPWICAAPEQLFVSWYDRRDAVSAGDDRTRYFVSLVQLHDNPNGEAPYQLSRAFETSVSALPDPQCRIWPAAPRFASDSDRCAQQPQLAGRCCVLNAENKCTNPSSRRCDFDSTPGQGTLPCQGKESCVIGGGQPKYGDYTGNACIQGRAFLTWASATNPQYGTPFDHTRAFFATADAMMLTIAQDLCNEKRCGGFEPGGLGEIFLRCPSGDCRIVLSVPDLCERMVRCPSCDNGSLCSARLTFEIDGLDSTWAVRLVGEDGTVANDPVQRTNSGIAFGFKPRLQQAINGRVGRFFLVLDRSGGSLSAIRTLIRVSPA